MTKPKLLMLKGLPASGKSTYAKELVEQGWIRVNKDDIRRLYFPEYTFKDEKKVVEIEDDWIENALDKGANVVVDDTNFNPKHKQRLQALSERLGATFEEKFIDTPFEECIKRNKKRPNSVPLEVIMKMYNQYIAPTREKAPVYNEDLEECIIVDIDGTIAHIAGDDPRNPYDASRAMEDSIDDAVSSIVAMAYSHGYKVIFLTGRHEGHLQVTKDWLNENGVNYDGIYCRGEEDKRPDYIVKEELYNEHIKDKYNVKFVIDDRPSVCRMWRSLKLPVMQVGDPHNEF